MKSLFKIYKTILVESQTNTCIDLFGKELFGDELGGYEKNTPLENRYHDEIIDFTDNMYGEEITPEFLSMVKNLKQCMSTYPEVLVPDNTTLYRGTVIPLSYFVNSGQPIKGTINYRYGAHSKIQSWTINTDIAEMFGDNKQLMEFATDIDVRDYTTPDSRQDLLDELLSADLRLAFILSYHSNPEDFLFKAKYFNRLSYNTDEDEILRVNNKVITVGATLNDRYNREYGGNKFKSFYNLLDLINLGIKNL